MSSSTIINWLEESSRSLALLVEVVETLHTFGHNKSVSISNEDAAVGEIVAEADVNPETVLVEAEAE